MLKDRKSLYQTVEVDGNIEKDYLSTNIGSMGIEASVQYTVPQYAAGRLDIVSLIHYGTVEYWWLIAQYNDILDPIESITTETVLQIPSIDEYYDFYDAEAKIEDEFFRSFERRKVVVE